MSCTRTITLSCIFFQIIELGTLVNAFLPKFKVVQAICMKLHAVVKYNKAMHHV